METSYASKISEMLCEINVPRLWIYVEVDKRKQKENYNIPNEWYKMLDEGDAAATPEVAEFLKEAYSRKNGTEKEVPTMSKRQNTYCKYLQDKQLSLTEKIEFCNLPNTVFVKRQYWLHCP